MCNSLTIFHGLQFWILRTSGRLEHSLGLYRLEDSIKFLATKVLIAVAIKTLFDLLVDHLPMMFDLSVHEFNG